jgi:hypothetical protein
MFCGIENSAFYCQTWFGILVLLFLSVGLPALVYANHDKIRKLIGKPEEETINVLFNEEHAGSTFSTSNETSENGNEVDRLSLNSVEKELVELGFEDFTIRSAIKYLGLDLPTNFHLLACYTDDSFKISLRLKTGKMISITLYADDKRINFIETNIDPAQIQFQLDEEILNKRFNTSDFKSAKEALNALKLTPWMESNCKNITIFLLEDLFDKINK